MFEAIVLVNKKLYLRLAFSSKVRFDFITNIEILNLDWAPCVQIRSAQCGLEFQSYIDLIYLFMSMCLRTISWCLRYSPTKL